ncbi:MAG: mechanosensitive ion channel family protein [Gemmatimonadetes bacterium]|nr:mechanosensitive ion channel family protein [Gemmatimonadota bacterium]
MQDLIVPLRELSQGSRILLILLVALAAHLMVLAVRRVGTWALAPDAGPASLARRRPKVASVTTLVVSTLTFVIYFTALGLVLGEVGISLTAYFASATVIGLAIGFGSQGLVQDIVIGLTLIFSDVLDVGDVADVGGQTGRVESIGLRFTTLRTLLDQRVIVPNRSMGQINRYRNGRVRAFVDVQLPDDAPADEVRETVEAVARGSWRQHRGIVLAEPRVLGVRETGDGGWRYLRLEVPLWPGQGTLVEGPLRQRIIAALRRRSPDYADWMVVVTWRTEE